MKPFWRHLLAAGVVLACCTVWLLSSRAARASRRTVTCQSGLQIDILDSAQRKFIAREDIEAWMDQDYHAYVGLPLDSVDLGRVEKLLNERSVVRESQAWLADDGILHIALTQREPVVRFQKGDNGWYADATGFIFPLQTRHSVRVPIVDGAIPLQVPRGYKGEIDNPQERTWLEGILNLVGFMQQEKVWAENISQISVGKSGELTLIPREGKERFLFGRPDRIAEKFNGIRSYYESIVPLKDPGYYATVDVRNRGQIICRQK